MVGKRETNGRLNDASFWAVIPAGGSGTRLWPLSRSGKPKFLLPLLGDRSLIQQTVGRLGELAPIERTLVICGPAHAVAVGRQLPELPESRIVVEPAPKGSGPAIARSAARMRRSALRLAAMKVAVQSKSCSRLRLGEEDRVGGGVGG